MIRNIFNKKNIVISVLALLVLTLGLLCLFLINSKNRSEKASSSFKSPELYGAVLITYETEIDKITRDNPEKVIYPAEVTTIRSNLPTTLNYDILKQKLKDNGFTFKVLNNGIVATESEPSDYTSMLSKLEVQYPDKKIGVGEESIIQNNLPSNMSWVVLKDMMLKVGFVFTGFKN